MRKCAFGRSEERDLKNRVNGIRAAVVVAAALLCGFALCGTMQSVPTAIFALLALPGFCGCYGYILARVRRWYSIAIPVVCVAGFIALGGNAVLSCAAVSFAVVASALFAITTLLRAEQFQSLLLRVLLYSVFWGVAVFSFLGLRYGSLSAGFEAVGKTVRFAFEATLDSSGLGAGMDSAEKVLLLQAMESAYLLLPTVIGYAGVISAMLERLILRLICAVNDDKNEIFYGSAATPRGFAVIFLICSLAAALSDGGMFYFIFTNLTNILTLLLAFDGIHEFVLAVKKDGLRHGRVTLVILAAYSLFVMPTMLITIAAYYDAFRAIFSRRGPRRRPRNT